MFQCPECVRLFGTDLEIKNHLKYIHAYSHLNFHAIACPGISCLVEISTWSGLQSHLKTFHAGGNSAENSEQLVDDLSEEQVEPSSSNIITKSASPSTENLENLDDISTEFGITLFTDLLHDLCSSLSASGVNNSIVDLVMKEMKYNFSEICKLICKIGFKYRINDFDAFSCQVNSLLAAFCKVKSSYNRLKLCKKMIRLFSL